MFWTDFESRFLAIAALYESQRLLRRLDLQHVDRVAIQVPGNPDFLGRELRRPPLVVQAVRLFAGGIVEDVPMAPRTAFGAIGGRIDAGAFHHLRMSAITGALAI